MFFETSDGVKIAYRRWGDRGGPVTVLHHGLTSDSLAEWKTPLVLGVLIDAGHHVLTLDARGHGASDTPHEISSYGLSRMVADLVELLDEVAADVEIRLVGYSLGAVVVLHACAELGQRVSRLVLGGVGSGIVEMDGLDTRVLNLAGLAEAFSADDASEIDDPELAAWRTQAYSAGADLKAISAVAAALRPEPAPLAEITVPTLVIAGLDDVLAQRPEVLSSALRRAELVLVGGSHSGARFDPDFAEAIRHFLTRSAE
ncbi:alpha/beta hydrolase [Rathayibacter caricis DSM 15933]|uniref:Alpha/beta hydrolase n=2 Tax=Rathayibacter caricis TaxID=110936 RepID=A0A2T4UQW3_9MICO|nr:alpha/beta hydrolase [Rathayibacter caricis DSM 15933]